MNFNMSLFRDHWESLIPFGVACAIVGYGIKSFLDKKTQGQVNPSIKKHEPKVVNMIDVEDIAEKAAFCRCWKSSKFPYCDGAHNAHNEQTGDNVGPVVIKRKK